MRHPHCHQSDLLPRDHVHMDAELTTDLQIDHLERHGRHLRIAVVTETYPPEVNGVSLTLSKLVSNLIERQHSIQLVRLRQPADGLTASADLPITGRSSPTPVMEAPILMRGIPIPRYPGLRMGLPCKGALLKLWSVRRPDVVHIATEGPLGWSALKAAQQLKLPVSSDFRTNFHAYSRHYGVGMLFRSIMLVLRKFHNRTHLTLVPTPTLKAQLEVAGFKRLAVVGRGVDVGLFHPSRRSGALRQAWGLTEDTLAVVYLGRLAQEKNLPQVVAAFEAIAQRRPTARLVLIGDGPMRQALESQCPNAIFTGMLKGPELAQALASTDLFLFPSETETYGNVVAEAMASGVPTVAYRMAAAGELIRDGLNGWAVEPGQPQAFVQAAVDAACDDGLRQRVALRCANDLQGLDWDSVTQQFERALLRLVDEQQRLSMAGISLPSWGVRS